MTPILRSPAPSVGHAAAGTRGATRFWATLNLATRDSALPVKRTSAPGACLHRGRRTRGLCIRRVQWGQGPRPQIGSGCDTGRLTLPRFGGGMPNVLAFGEEDHHLGNVGGMVGDPLQ